MDDHPETRVSATAQARTPEDPQAFALAANLARRWLSRQATEFGIPDLDPTSPLQSAAGPHSRIFIQNEPKSLAFAFSHDDERDSETSWRVVGAIEARDGRADVTVEVGVATQRTGVVAPLGMPAFLADIADEVGLEDVWPLTSTPRTITTDNAADLANFIRNPARRLPVVAFSQPLPVTREEVDRIARRVVGAAHVVIVNVAASFVISEQLGRDFSVYQGAVRVLAAE